MRQYVFVYGPHTAKGRVMNMQNRDTSFPYWPYKDYTAFGSNIHHSNLFYTSEALVKIGETLFLAMVEDG